MASQYIYTGNEVRVVMDGVELDLVQTIRGSDDYGDEYVSGIGDIHGLELVPTFARHTVTISGFALKKEKAILLGIIRENGDEALKGKHFTIEIFSKEGPLLRKWEDAVNNSGDINVTAHRIVVKDATFMALDAAGTYATR